MAEAEFSVYPFVTGHLEPYVQAALEEARRSGLSVQVGPLGTTVRGDLEEIVTLLERVQRAAFRHGATKVVTSVTIEDEGGPAARAAEGGPPGGA